MSQMLPDLTHYAQGLDAATFPVKIHGHASSPMDGDVAPNSDQGDAHSKSNPVQENDDHNDLLSVTFTVVTLEQSTAKIQMDGQGFKVLLFESNQPSSTTTSTLTSPDQHNHVLPTTLSDRQREAMSGHVYETIEACLMALSPGFETFFGQELIRRLETISWERLQQPSSDDESHDSDSA